MGCGLRKAIKGWRVKGLVLGGSIGINNIKVMLVACFTFGVNTTKYSCHIKNSKLNTLCLKNNEIYFKTEILFLTVASPATKKSRTYKFRTSTTSKILKIHSLNDINSSGWLITFPAGNHPLTQTHFLLRMWSRPALAHCKNAVFGVSGVYESHVNRKTPGTSFRDLNLNFPWRQKLKQERIT